MATTMNLLVDTALAMPKCVVDFQTTDERKRWSSDILVNRLDTTN